MQLDNPMDDLEVNPLYQALLSRFRSQFELSCKLSYLIAIPHSDTLADSYIDQAFANSHLLKPSKLLKMFVPQIKFQVGFSNDIELDQKKLIVYLDKQHCNPNDKGHLMASNRNNHNVLIVNIIADEIAYNVNNGEFRTILIDRPLVHEAKTNNSARPFIQSLLCSLSPLHHRASWTSSSTSSSASSTSSSSYSSSSSSSSSSSTQIPLYRIGHKRLKSHQDCSKYLESISQSVTTNLEDQVKLMQSNYMIVAKFLDDAAARIRHLVEIYVPKYEHEVVKLHKSTITSDTVAHVIRLSVENYVMYLLHGKLTSPIQTIYERHDRRMAIQYNLVEKSGLTVSQLGAQQIFCDFQPSEKLANELRHLTECQCPLEIVSSIMQSIAHINEIMSQNVKFKHLIMTMGNHHGDSVTICSDDIIASLVYSIVRSKPRNLYSLSKYLETFGWSSCAKDQSAYYTATFQLVVQYIYRYSDSGHNNGKHKLLHIRDNGGVNTNTTKTTTTGLSSGFHSLESNISSLSSTQLRSVSSSPPGASTTSDNKADCSSSDGSFSIIATDSSISSSYDRCDG